MSEGNPPRRPISPEQREYNRGQNSSHFQAPYAAESDAARRMRAILSKEIQSSKRSGAWYRVGRMERGFLRLALRLKVRLDSPALLRALVGVLKKLKEAGNGAYAAFVRGSRLAWAFSVAAVSWGNQGAKEWRNDRGYIEFLGRATDTRAGSRLR